MNLRINLDNKICLTQNIASLMVKIIGDTVRVYKEIVMLNNLNINIDKLEVNKHYLIIISLVVDGKQLLKEFKEFTYEDYDEYIIDENIMIKRQKTNNILKRVMLITPSNLKGLKLALNPLVAYREEHSNIISLYLNGGIILVKKDLFKILQKIIHNEYKVEEKYLENLNSLLLKGCLIAYEK